MTTYPRTAADAIHYSTKHGTPAAHPKRLVSYPRLDPGNAPTRSRSIGTSRSLLCLGSSSARPCRR
jgi:hypothetical protein